MSEKVVLGGGCFWCTEAVFKKLKGVRSVTSGYAGGSVENPTYDQVSTGNTGHAEVVQIEYDPDTISLEQILEVFFATHDPTTLNRQGADIGSQYRSVIFYTDDKQKEVAQKVVNELSGNFASAITTTFEPLREFYPAEDYHQEYYERNPGNIYCSVVITPKLQKVEEKYSKFLA